MCSNGKDNSSKELKAWWDKVLDALLWFTGTNVKGQPNNLLYKNIVIILSDILPDSLPENGYLSGTTWVDFDKK